MATAIDLFCGAGGLSLGLEKAGFEILAGNDLFSTAGQTFSAAHPSAHFFDCPIEELSSNKIRKVTGIGRGELTLLAGGPPCQAYSVYNHKRGMEDSRATLFKQYLRIVDELRPHWILMENVAGIYSIGGGEAVRAIKYELAQLGYEVEEKLLKAEEFGVPQERRRVVFIGNRIGAQNTYPSASHGPNLLPLVTIRDAIDDLPELRNGESCNTDLYRTLPISRYQMIVRGNNTQILNHSAPRLGQVNMNRLEFIPQGGSWRDIPYEMLPAGMKKAKRSDHTKRYGRMEWDKQSCTILTKCDIHWGAYIHPEQQRAISVHEAARIQSFPDSFEFFGSKTEQYIQVGNAVPPLLAEALGEQLLANNHSARKLAA